jgi:F0F1-type ATP synthase membrane subunit b/b'
MSSNKREQPLTTPEGRQEAYHNVKEGVRENITDPAKQQYERAKDTMQEKWDQTKQSAHETKEQAKDKWEQTKQDAKDTKDKANTKLEEGKQKTKEGDKPSALEQVQNFTRENIIEPAKDMYEKGKEKVNETFSSDKTTDKSNLNKGTSGQENVTTDKRSGQAIH